MRWGWFGPSSVRRPRLGGSTALRQIVPQAGVRAVPVDGGQQAIFEAHLGSPVERSLVAMSFSAYRES